MFSMIFNKNNSIIYLYEFHGISVDNLVGEFKSKQYLLIQDNKHKFFQGLLELYIISTYKEDFLFVIDRNKIYDVIEENRVKFIFNIGKQFVFSYIFFYTNGGGIGI